MKRSGYADLPLHGGRVPAWLAERMAKLGGAIIEVIVRDYGTHEVLRRLSDPFWFQAFGALLGMDWHSSGITTSVMGALKRAVNPLSRQLGIYICGGRGRHSRNTPSELLTIADATGLDGDRLVRCSRLSARVDNNAVQDGFQLYLHSFILADDGQWAVVQQGMNDGTGMARRYHWLSESLRSFVEEPHAYIYGQNRGTILNLTDHEAAPARQDIVTFSGEKPERSLGEVRKLVMPRHHDVRAGDVDLKRLGAVLALAHDRGIADFESLLLLEGLGPRTMQSLAMVSEVIHGNPTHFRDPARFSFAHGGKDGHPFPVKTATYDETIEFLRGSLHAAKIDQGERNQALKRMTLMVDRIARENQPMADFDRTMRKEWEESNRYGGRTVFDDTRGKRKKKKNSDDDGQLTMF